MFRFLLAIPLLIGLHAEGAKGAAPCNDLPPQVYWAGYAVGSCVAPAASKDKCKLDCADGWTNTGNLQTQCTDGVWSTNGYCVAQCQDPPSILSQPGYTGTCPTPKNSGFTCSGVSCASGYTSVGSLATTCNNGTWTTPGYCGAQCTAQPTALTSLQGLTGSCSVPVVSGSNCTTLACNQVSGYSLRGSLQVTCDSGAWTFPTGYCAAPCTSQPDVGLLGVSAGNCTGTVPDGQFCDLSCNTTSYTVNGSLRVSCTNGTWSTKTGSCAAKCTSYPVEVGQNGITSGNCTTSMNSGSTCVLSCMNGYTLNGNLNINCLNGIWTSPTGNCATSCQTLPLLPAGLLLNSTCPVPANPNTACQLKCDNGYVPVGGNGSSLVVKCSATSTWSINGSCQDADACAFTPCLSANATCEDLPPPAPTNSSGRICTCRTGFTGNGDVCEDTNACVSSPCSSSFAMCQDLPPPNGNTSSGRICTCNAGYSGNGDTCVDIDACVSSPCGSGYKAQCIDQPPPASNLSSGRQCLCGNGWSGDGDTCLDIDECLTTSVCVAPSVCLNTQGGYSCAPYIVPQTLAIISGEENPLSNGDSGIVVASTLGGAVLKFDVSNGLNVSYSKLRFGGTPTLSDSYCPTPSKALVKGFFQCSNLQTNVINSTTTSVYCTIPAGYGSCLSFILEVCAMKAQDPNETTICKNITGTDYFSYPHPTLRPGTLRFGSQGEQFATTFLQLDPNNPSSRDVQFEGTNLIPDLNAMLVTYGPILNPKAFTCLLNPLLTTSNLIVCTPQSAGPSNNILRIEIPSAAYETNTTDQLQFSFYPNIQQVLGCPINGCPTEGTILTLLGTDFALDTTAFIGGIECPTISVSVNGTGNSSNITCNLKPGMGKNLPILLTSNGRQAISLQTLSFQPPTIFNMTSTFCTSVSSGLIDCPRGGNVIITINGENFGESNALVLISGYECSSVTYLIYHQMITCILPQGIYQQQPLSVVVGMQQDTSHNFISYQECVPGTYQMYSNPSLGTTCGNCSVGKYTSTYGSSMCLPCPSGSYSGVASANCSDCEPGSWSNTSGGAEICYSCPAGTARAEGYTLGCSSCEIGLYTNVSGLTACLNCPAGLYALSKGATICDVCERGYYRPSNSLQGCLPCQQGEFAKFNSSATCSSCPGGTWSFSTGASSCDLCAPGLSRESGSSEPCTSCQIGSFANQSGLSACENCEAGKEATDPGSTYCTECAVGYARDSGSRLACQPCQQGYFMNLTGHSQCVLCPSGTYSLESGQSVCDLCKPGLARGAGSTDPCTQCQVGKFTNLSGSATCLDCSPGTELLVAGSTACTACLPGTARSLTLACQPCQQGEFTNVSGLSSCTLCPAGRWSVNTSSSVCDKCKAGYYRQAGSPEGCLQCPVGSFTNTSGFSSCVECPSGTEATATGSIICTDCPPGKSRPIGLPTCELCSQGFYFQFNLSSNCLPCPGGTYSTSPGALVCDKCEVGLWRSSDSLQGCTACLPGYFANITGLATCYPCPDGTYNASSGAITCGSCETGKARSRGSIYGCLPCGAGTMAPDPGLTECVACYKGTFSNSSQMETCTLCPIGRYVDTTGNIECDSCAIGFYSNVSGVTICNNCKPGTWSDSAASVCYPCPPGTFRLEQSGGCEACPLGRYQTNVGSSECTDCSAGFYQSNYSQTFCLPCSKGRISVTGQSSCTSCDLQGGYNTKEGSTDCIKCSGGLSCLNGIAQPLTGYWVYESVASGSVLAVQCPIGLCGSNDTCGLNRLNYSDNPLCGKCEEGYSEWGGTCMKCDKGGSAGIIFALVLVSWVYVCILHVLSQETSSPRMKVLLYFVATSHYLIDGKFYWLSWIWFMDFNLNDASGKVCVASLDAYQKLALQLFTPLLYFGQLGITMLLHWYYVRYRLNLIVPLNKFVTPYIRTCFAILLFSYSMITSLCFRYLSCANVGTSQVVFTMPSVDCNSERYYHWRVLVILLLIFPVIGLPLCLALLLWKYRSSIKLYDPVNQKFTTHLNGDNGTVITEEDEMVVARYGILFATYRPERYYWEVWALGRRALLLGIGNGLQPFTFIRLQILIVINFIILVLQILQRPFHEGKQGNRIETFSLIGLVLLSVFTTDMQTQPYEQVLVTLITIVCVVVLSIVVVRGSMQSMHKVIKTRRERSEASKIERSRMSRQADPNVVEMQSLASLGPNIAETPPRTPRSHGEDRSPRASNYQQWETSSKIPEGELISTNPSAQAFTYPTPQRAPSPSNLDQQERLVVPSPSYDGPSSPSKEFPSSSISSSKEFFPPVDGRRTPRTPRSHSPEPTLPTLYEENPLQQIFRPPTGQTPQHSTSDNGDGLDWVA